MSDFENLTCEPCQSGSPAVRADERAAFLSEHPDWEIVEIDGEPQLRKLFTFSDFAEALAFTDRVGALAESVGHHPALLTEWGKVTVRWWTHKIGNIHRNDLMMAARTDRLAAADAS